jgi:hypothetical protein
MGHSYRELIAWKKAMDFVMDVYHASRAFPRDEVYGLAGQIRRAVSRKARHAFRAKSSTIFLDALAEVGNGLISSIRPAA